ncbi:unnamed protein product [Mytilus coruscus]|uniref:Uncharacterized protein n=1 Tax=Mytilus coruscus TaxID=42192 RepID=A0A6J8E6B0_MYTCO|nr:unnamed protein product [Mytilus coruscus]
MKPTQGLRRNNEQTVRKVDWNKIDKDIYKQALSVQLDMCDFTINDPVENNEAITNINTSVTGGINSYGTTSERNKTLKGDNNILEGWKTRFANLAKESDSSNFDQDYFDLVDSEYLQTVQICLDVYKHEEVTTNEFEKASHKFNRNKSDDVFCITAECLLFRGERLDSTLLEVINTPFQHCYISNNLKTGTLTPIFKNKGDILN